MTQIKQHTLQSGEKILLVKVPSDAVEIKHSKIGNWLSWMIPDGDYLEFAPIQDLPEGNWQLIGLSDEITEEQAKELVDVSEWYDPYQTPYGAIPCYKGYIDDVWKWQALESFKSLMQSLGCEGRYAVLREVK